MKDTFGNNQGPAPCSVAPSGLHIVRSRFPGVDTPGYQPSALRAFTLPAPCFPGVAPRATSRRPSGPRILTLLFVVVLALAGCRSQREIPQGPQPAAPARADGPATLQRPFSASVEGMTVNGQLRWQRDSVVWVSASKIIELGRARITRDSLIAYIPPYNQYLRMDMATVRRQFGIDFDSLQRAILAYPAPIVLSHPALSTPLRVTFPSPGTTGQPLSFPLTIPSSAKPLNL